MTESDKLQLDYEETLQQYRLLADIRFKLLAFVPTVSALAVTLLTNDASVETRLAVGLLGFTVTLGILFYELRNSKFYDASIHRLKCLEATMEMTICTKDRKLGGLFNERPRRRLRLFGLVAVWHDRGLALVYVAALGGWAFITTDALFSLAGDSRPLISILIAAFVSSVLIWEFHRLEKLDRPQPTAEMVRLSSGASQ